MTIDLNVTMDSDDPDEEAEAGKDQNPDLVLNEIEKKLSLGSSLPDLEKFYLLYCEYAYHKGFSVRKGEQRYFGRSSEIRWKEFKCSCTGLPDGKSLRHRAAVYKKLVTRTDCKAKLRVSREELGPFRVTVFESDHNHALVPIEQSYLLRSSRNLNYAKQSVLETMNSVGIGVSRACAYMEKESGGVQNVGFTRKDAYHHIERMKRATKVEDGDANELLQYFVTKSNKEPYFYWKYQLDDDGRVMNLFFRDSRCAVDYDVFGDVMCVDTTFRTNRYNLICAPFVGINHHSSNVMFGMAFLSDETTASFIWLFKAFLESMHGKEPKVIFTDQCQAMMNAIDRTFPNARHRLCQWHINKNAPSYFGKWKNDASFKSLWHKCMNRVESEAEFKETWDYMLQTYMLTDNDWFARMYELRHRWASVFTRGVFTGGLLATSRSESTNKALKDVTRPSSSLYEFVQQYELVQKKWRTNESTEDTFCLWLPGQIVPNNRLLSHAATVYTRTIFKLFELEVINSLNVLIAEDPRDIGDDNLEYKTSPKVVGSRVRTIVFNKQSHHASCSCGMWETKGIFCRHILKVYNIKDVDAIPKEFIIRRWTKKAKERGCWQTTSGNVGSMMEYMKFVNQIMRHVYEMASSAKEYEVAREMIIQRINELRSDVADIIGPSGCMDKTKSTSTPEGLKFRDPKKVRDRGFVNARLVSHWERAKRKGSKRTTKTTFANKASKRASKKAMNTEETSSRNTFTFMDNETNEHRSQEIDDVEFYWNF